MGSLLFEEGKSIYIRYKIVEKVKEVKESSA